MLNLESGRARRRLSLFAGGSLAAVSILGAAAGVTFVPTAAMAANECGDPAANGATADVFACTGVFSSISYPSTNGNLTLTLTNGPTVTSGGLSVTGTGANTVTINRSDATPGAGDPSITNTGGAGISATTGTGALVLTLTDGDFGADTPLSITGTTAGVQLQSGASTATALNMTFNSGSITATGPTGVGVIATGTSVGAGNVILQLGGSVSGATGVRATSSGTGAIAINVTGVSATVAGGDIVGQNGAAIQVTPGALANINVQTGRVVRASNATGGVIEVTNINATRTATITNAGTIRSNDDTIAGYDDLAIVVGGGAGNAAYNGANGLLQGRFSLLNTGNVTINLGTGIWHSTGVNTFGAGAGATTFTSANGSDGTNAGVIGTNANGAATSFVFGDGVDAFTNGGVLAMGEGEEAAATLLFTGLETWDNGGQVLFGVDPDLETRIGGRPVASDGVANDRIVAHGVAFNGTTVSTPGLNTFNSSNFIMDVDLSADQADCAAAVTADCLDLRDGSAIGSTPIDVRVVGAGFAERLVLVDVSGAGVSEATAFSLSPNSDGYLEIGDAGALEAGLFLYTLEFDEAAEQYALTASGFGGRTLETAHVARATAEPWRTATGAWSDRQTDLRRAIEDGRVDTNGGVWLRVAGNFIEESSFENSAAGIEYETSADQRTTALVGGVDLVRLAGGAMVVGVTAGKLDSTLDFTGGDAEMDMDGHSMGAYASFMGERLYVDGIFNRTELDLTLAALGGQYEMGATSTGFQAEAGYQLLQIGDGGARIEPLVALSRVKTDVDDLSVGPVLAQFDAQSTRGAVGVRFSGESDFRPLTAAFSFTTRLWKEFDGDSETRLAASFAEVAYIDQAPEELAEVGVALGLSTPNDWLSASVGYGVKFAEDYQSTDASLTLRIAW